MEDKPYVIVAVGALIAFCLYCVLTWSPDPSGSSEGGDAPAATPLLPAIFGGSDEDSPSTQCGEVVERCITIAETKIDRCDQAAAKAKLTQLLASPMKTDACRAAQRRLDEACGAGCEIDFTNLLAIPGDVKISTSGTIDEFSQCLVRGQRQVSIRAKCQPITR